MTPMVIKILFKEIMMVWNKNIIGTSKDDQIIGSDQGSQIISGKEMITITINE